MTREGIHCHSEFWERDWGGARFKEEGRGGRSPGGRFVWGELAVGVLESGERCGVMENREGESERRVFWRKCKG